MAAIVDIVCWGIIWLAIGLVFIFFIWSLCDIAKRSDDISDAYWDEYWSREEDAGAAGSEEAEETED